MSSARASQTVVQAQKALDDYVRRIDLSGLHWNPKHRRYDGFDSDRANRQVKQLKSALADAKRRLNNAIIATETDADKIHRFECAKRSREASSHGGLASMFVYMSGDIKRIEEYERRTDSARKASEKRFCQSAYVVKKTIDGDGKTTCQHIAFGKTCPCDCTVTKIGRKRLSDEVLAPESLTLRCLVVFLNGDQVEFPEDADATIVRMRVKDAMDGYGRRFLFAQAEEVARGIISAECGKDDPILNSFLPMNLAFSMYMTESSDSGLARDGFMAVMRNMERVQRHAQQNRDGFVAEGDRRW